MKTYVECKKCGEQDDKKTTTGARIDWEYFCESCYNEKLNELDKEVIIGG